ncbi:hypothetical protein OBBRIDRAFT_829906 [Obba rivulosa]|uniref:BTB domain-containing protein n=1 Tax=Obba rivulosa TaxID=1052685 RepID=A0A8E2DVT4_9APHY|nr:hypothetical protein OBBRIDRAFT_829906 [Obba rivulosa]
MSQQPVAQVCKDESSSTRVHPLFSAENADIVLSSKDDTHFRVRSQLLRETSGWFNTLLSIPSNAPDTADTDIICLDETADILAALLRMVSGFEIPELHPINLCEDILYAAEKYEMPGPVSIIRVALSSNLLDASPIRIYGIAARRGWAAEAKAASTRTLPLDLFHPDAVAELNRLDGPVLMKLLLLHHSRRQAFKAALDDTRTFYASGGSTLCGGCAQHVDHIQWALCKYSWVTQAPITHDILHEESARKALESTCPHCGKSLYMQYATIGILKGIIDGLPRAVEFP